MEGNSSFTLEARNGEILLEICRGLCVTDTVSENLRVKIKQIFAYCELQNFVNLHKTSVVDDTLIGISLNQCQELSFEEQNLLKSAVEEYLDSQTSLLINEVNIITDGILVNLTDEDDFDKLGLEKNNEIEQLQLNIVQKVGNIKNLEEKKVQTILEWLNFKLNDVNAFGENSVELHTVKNKMLNLKSKIIHLQILQTLFTETKCAVKAYTEIEKDLKASIATATKKIKEYKQIISNEKF